MYFSIAQTKNRSAKKSSALGNITLLSPLRCGRASFVTADRAARRIIVKSKRGGRVEPKWRIDSVCWLFQTRFCNLFN